MKKRPLGTTGITIAPLVFGGNVFGWTADEKTSFQLLDAFLDRGFNMVDTANMYSTWVPGHTGGESETILGKWFRSTGKRDQVILSTKVGMAMGDGSKGLSRDYILSAVEDSLRRLQTDVIDVYHAHQDDADTPLEETLAAFDELVRAGKVRSIASSNYSAPRLREALETSAAKGLAAYATHQPEYNLYARADYEQKLEPLLVEKGLAVIPYFSLASGFLSGKYRTAADLAQSPRGEAFVKQYLNPRGLAILDALDAVARAHGVSASAVALAWLLARPSVTAPIVSATKLAQMDAFTEAVELTLSDTDLATLNQASDPS